MYYSPIQPSYQIILSILIICRFFGVFYIETTRSCTNKYIFSVVDLSSLFFLIQSLILLGLVLSCYFLKKKEKPTNQKLLLFHTVTTVDICYSLFLRSLYSLGYRLKCSHRDIPKESGSKEKKFISLFLNSPNVGSQVQFCHP